MALDSVTDVNGSLSRLRQNLRVVNNANILRDLLPELRSLEQELKDIISLAEKEHDSLALCHYGTCKNQRALIVGDDDEQYYDEFCSRHKGVCDF